MYSDAYFYGKSGYEPCQDYAIAFPGDVRLSDGCGSCQRSDIGSRLLCLYGGDAEQLSILLKENVFFNQEDFYATYNPASIVALSLGSEYKKMHDCLEYMVDNNPSGKY